MDEWSAIHNVLKPDGRLKRLMKVVYHKLIKCQIYFENKKYEKPCPHNQQVRCVQFPATEGVDDLACNDECIWDCEDRGRGKSII